MKALKNFFYNASYQLLILLIPLITQPYISRVLQPVGNGIYTNTYNTMQYFILIGDLGISVYANREIAYHRDSPLDRSKIFWEIELLQILTTSCAAICFFIFVAVDRHNFNIQLIQLFWLVAAGIDISWYFMALEDFGKTVIRNTIVKLASVSLIFIFVKSPDDLWKYAVIQGAAQLLGALTLWPYLRETIVPVQWSKLNVFRHFKPSLVLFVPNIAIQVYSVINKSMLKHFDSFSALSFFTFGDNLVKTVLAIVTATGAVMLPRIASRFARGDLKAVHESLYRNMNFVASISFPLMFGLAAMGERFAPKFFGSQYLISGQVIFAEAPIIVLIAWSTVIGRQYLMPVQRMREYTTSVTIGAVVNVLANIPLILNFGAVGAAIATVIAEAAVTIYQVWTVQDSLELRRMFQGQWKYLFSGAIMFFIVRKLTNYWSMSILHIIIDVAVGGAVYVICILLVRAQIIDEVRRVVRSRFNHN
ncbi:oligosaccharide flippase family protein [Furfurilactobacillus curtus]|uniref:Flippase n=1 Tax=Furfurilactobacillus curtus TaxID=1746200 RepID=A0ABQ5JSY1_9LACO